MASEARIRANKKYQEQVEDIIIRVKKGRKDEVRTYAQSLGMSMNAYINSLIEKDLGQSNLDSV